jgi:hypothetical protein
MLPNPTQPRIRLHWLLFPILLAILCTSCQNNQPSQSAVSPPDPGQPPVYFTTLKVDSILVFPLSDSLNYFSHGFIFSPFEKNKIWVTPSGKEAFELDLQTGRKTLFSVKFGHTFFSKNIHPNHIFIDPFDPAACWFMHPYVGETGVFRYDQSKAQGQFFGDWPPHLDVYTLSFTQNYVWIGTNKGLWAYDRHTGKVRIIDYAPEDAVRSIGVTKGDVVVVNEHYRYNPEARCWDTLSDSDDRGQVTPTNREDNGRELPPNLPLINESYAVGFAPREIWHLNSLYWFSSGYSDALYKYYRPVVRNYVASLRADSDHLYVLYPDKFLIVNKAYLQKTRTGDPNLLIRIKQFHRMADSLMLKGSGTWSAWEAKIAYLEAQFHAEKDSIFRDMLNKYRSDFPIPYDAAGLHSLLSVPNLDTLIADQAYLRLLRIYVEQGSLKQANQLAKECLQKMPKPGFLKTYSSSLSALDRCIQQLDSIKNTQTQEDERLWANAQVLEQFCGHQEFKINEASCYDAWLADSVYHVLVLRFPKSSRADDAGFRLTELRFSCKEGDDEDPEEVLAWKKFLKKHPDSKHRPEALCNMASAFGHTTADLRQGLKWVEEAEKLRPELFVKGKPESRLWMKEEFQRSLDFAELNFSIQIKKNIVRKNEPVQVVFSLKNLSTRDIKIQGQINHRFPNFNIEAMPEGTGTNCFMSVPFIESPTPPRHDDSDFGDIHIAPGKTYSETWDITQTAFKRRSFYLGHYAFDRPGAYLLKAFWMHFDDEKITEPVRLIVE